MEKFSMEKLKRNLKRFFITAIAIVAAVILGRIVFALLEWIFGLISKLFGMILEFSLHHIVLVLVIVIVLSLVCAFSDKVNDYFDQKVFAMFRPQNAAYRRKKAMKEEAKKNKKADTKKE